MLGTLEAVEQILHIHTSLGNHFIIIKPQLNEQFGKCFFKNDISKNAMTIYILLLKFNQNNNMVVFISYYSSTLFIKLQLGKGGD